MGTRLSASRLSLAHACAYPFKPGLEVPEDEPGVAALTGSSFASLRAHHIDPSRPIVIEPGADEARARALFKVWKRWWTVFSSSLGTELTWETEVAFALQLETGEVRRIETRGHRDYGDAVDGEIVGTADLFAVDESKGRVIVLDDKTGSPLYVQAAAENAQLRMLAAAGAKRAGKTDALVGLVFVNEVDVSTDFATLDAMDLDAAEADLRILVDRIPTAPPAPGDHCRYCPARTVCPVFTGGAETLGADRAALATVAAGGALTVERVAQIWPQLRLLKAGIEQIEARVKAAVEAHGKIPLDHGKALGMVESTRETLSKASIGRALPAKDAAQVIEMLRAAGAIEVSTSRSMREVKL